VPEQATKLSPTTHAPAASIVARPLHDEIAALAYSLWQSRGCRYGMADEDWFNAEKELIEKAVEQERLLGQV
jgi:hypothetical protein